MPRRRLLVGMRESAQRRLAHEALNLALELERVGRQLRDEPQSTFCSGYTMLNRRWTQPDFRTFFNITSDTHRRLAR